MKDESGIIVYLDTSDYIRLCYRKTEQDRELFDELMAVSSERSVKYYFSYFSVFELLQDYKSEFRDDRLKRAQFLKSLCDGNQFKFFIDLISSESPIGQWYPEEYNKLIDIDYFVEGLIERIANHGSVPRELKKLLKTSNGRQIAFTKYPQLLNIVGTKFHFSQGFIENNVFRNYALKRIKREEANTFLREMINDIELFFLNYFDEAQMKNIFVDAFHKISKMMHRVIEYSNSLERNPIIDSFDIRICWKNFRAFFPEHAADIFNAYVRENFKNMHLQDSDVADICHAIYLPYCDLWRGDVHFSNILDKYCHQFAGKIVPNLKLLPERIKHFVSE